MTDFERIDADMSESVACANSACPTGAMVPLIRLFGHEFPSLCPACSEEATAADEERDRRERLERLMARSGSTPRMREWSLETYPGDGARALAAGEEWLAEYRAGGRRNLFLYGPAGRGKTGLAWSIVRDLIERDLRDARLVNWRDLLHRMQQSFDEFGPRVSTEELFGLSVLCLDDLGAESPTDWRRSELATLIEHRYQQLLPTIFTSNYELRELRARLGRDDPVIGERLTSRIADGAWRVEVGGEDRRLKRPGLPSGPARQV